MISSSVCAETLAWWRFEAGPDGSNVVHYSAVLGEFSPDVNDSSGNGYALSVWSGGGGGGYAYRSDTPAGQIPQTGNANNFSVRNTGDYPCMFTESGTQIQSITPPAWTIEVAFQPEGTASYRTLVGRDSYGAAIHGNDLNLAALYLQITSSDELAIKFCDVSGYWHEAISAPGLVQGFTFATDPTGTNGQWQAAVATCDGITLKLYYRNIEAGDPGFFLVAETNLTLSGSPDTRLTAGTGDGSDWDRGTWTVGRGLYNGGYGDWAYGFIDEVRISLGALTPESFLFYEGPAISPLATVLNTDDSGTGSLRQVIADASDGDTVTFTNTLSGQTIGLTSGQILVDKNLTIDASSLPSGIAINGNGSSRIFEFASGTTNTLIGLTLTNGYASGSGGAIYLGSQTALTLSNCTLVGNSAGDGGGIANGGTLTLNNSMLSGNSAQYGGSINNSSGTLTLNNSTLSRNFADYGGGGIENYNATLTLNNSTLSGNSALWGGGVEFVGGLLRLNHATLSGNSAIYYGGGIYNLSGTLLTFTNTIVAGNTAPSSANIYGPFSGTHNLTNDIPQLAPLGNYGGPTQTMPPLPCSPAIDAGLDTGSLPATDQRGFARVVKGTVDIGAVEFQKYPDVALFWPTDWDGDGHPFGLELALGLNPLVPDAGAAGRPTPYPPASGNGIEFGFNDAATNYTAWVVKRSLDLSVPNSFVEIYRYDGPTGITTRTNDLSVNFTTGAIQIIDNTTPQPPSAFYQLSIEPSP